MDFPRYTKNVENEAISVSQDTGVTGDLSVGSETGLILTAATLRTLPLKGLGWKSLLREQCPQTF